MKYIERNRSEFHPDKRQALKHNLCSHPLMQLEELKKLALRHPTVRYHSAKISRSQKLDTVAKDCPNGMSLKDTLDNIESSGSFVFIMDVQKDAIYAPFVNELLGEVQGDVERYHHNMRNRQAWIFITSPGGVTPYHRDQEAAHYFHIKGEKSFWLWDANDREIVTQEENEFFHGVHGLKKTDYADSKMTKAEKFTIYPGDGIYFPYTAPHMVENGTDEYSISFSVTHMTTENYNTRRINKINQLLRKIGIKPRDLDQSGFIDNLKLTTHFMLRSILGLFKKSWINT
jgi:mannose-6-phosphate isomerase-like protein (cupin superfamily)